MKTKSLKFAALLLAFANSPLIEGQVTISGPVQISSGLPGLGKVLTSDNVGNATWQTPSGGGGGSGWALLGNSGTTDGINFLGTTDNVPLTIITNNTRAGRIDHIRMNTTLGFQAGNNLSASTGGQFNSALGFQAMQTASGNRNIAVGYQALQNGLTSTDDCIAIGYQAMMNQIPSPIPPRRSIAIGAYANNTEYGTDNCSMGYEAMRNAQSYEGIAIGYRANYQLVGQQNIGIGFNALSVATSGTQLTAMGAWADASSGLSNATALGSNAVVNASNKIRLGSNTVGVIEGAPAFYTSSDGRFKYNLNEDDVKGLDFIMKLRPVVYNLDTRRFQEFLCSQMPDSIRAAHMKLDYQPSSNIRRSGFIAQEVETAAKQSGYNFDGVHVPETDKDNYSLAYSQFVVPLVKAVQEHQAMIKSLEEKVTSYQRKIEELNSQIKGLSDNSGIADGSYMLQNEPNPFSHETTVQYQLPANSENAYMVIYDLTGKQLTRFQINDLSVTSIKITSENLAPGIYIYSIIADGKSIDSKRMVVADK